MAQTLYTFTEEQEARFWRIEDALRSYGYIVVAEPVPGGEEIFLNDLKETFKKLDDAATAFRRSHGYRGRSVRLLTALHTHFPHPSFNVNVGD